MGSDPKCKDKIGVYQQLAERLTMKECGTPESSLATSLAFKKNKVVLRLFDSGIKTHHSLFRNSAAILPSQWTKVGPRAQ